jgi:EAL domain-containing protein (putative c-di-GMP-specific phosphodiesterase class I)/ActR/RegA family two-component response regulator
MLQILQYKQPQIELATSALNAILRSSNFVGSPQLSAFLHYVVTETMEGRASKLKAYSIATQALGKPDSFDPVYDATVRVVAGRVRAALELYYSRNPNSIDLVIELLPGSYIPHFGTRTATSEKEAHTSSTETKVVIRPPKYNNPHISTANPNFQATHRLLVLEDSNDIRPLLARVGQEAGFTVFETADANEFWLAFRSFKPTHIFLDMVLPSADGLEIMRELGRLSATCKITLISGVDPRVLKTAEGLGRQIGLNITGAISKPFDIEKLSAELIALKSHGDQFSNDDLLGALNASELTLHYQPKLTWDESGKSHTTGVEGLVRWNHPKRGTLLPELILPAFDQAGLMVQLNNKIIQIAISQLTNLRKHFPEMHISINLSGQALLDQSFPDQLAAQMDDVNIPRQQLMLEINESIASNTELGATDAIIHLALKGFCLSMDDFGSGHFSLLKLLRMPFSELKLDRYIVGECQTSSDARVIVQTIIGLAKNLKFRPCAVGIDDQETFELIRSLGCDLVQGNFFSPPVHSEKLYDVINSLNSRQW